MRDEKRIGKVGKIPAKAKNEKFPCHRGNRTTLAAAAGSRRRKDNSGETGAPPFRKTKPEQSQESGRSPAGGPTAAPAQRHKKRRVSEVRLQKPSTNIIKMAATYSPAGMQYHRRDRA